MKHFDALCELGDTPKIPPASRRALRVLTLTALTMCALAACTPEVQLKAPEKPIEINLNVNIEHHIKVEIEKDVRTAINKNPDIF